jgi:hypothetical protein
VPNGIVWTAAYAAAAKSGICSIDGLNLTSPRLKASTAQRMIINATAA